MSSKRTSTMNLVLAALMVVSAMRIASGGEAPTGSATQSAAPATGDQADPGVAQFQKLRTELIQAALDQAAARLQIRASQEPEWRNFASAFEAMNRLGALAATANNTENAAELLHLRAETAMRRAQGLETLADAASKLQSTLDPDQREVFAQIVRAQLERHAMLRGLMMNMYAPRSGSPPQDAAAADPATSADPPGGGGGSHGAGSRGVAGGHGGFSGGGVHGAQSRAGGVPGGGFHGVPGGGFRGAPAPGGFRGRFYGRGFPGWWWGPGWFGLDLYLATLPWYYDAYLWDGVPYYYVNGDYYVWNGDAGEYEQVQPPSQIAELGPGQASVGADHLFAYPKNGQTAKQQATDENQCGSWASTQSGYTPPATGTETNGANSAAFAKQQDYLRAYAACLEARGYSVD